MKRQLLPLLILLAPFSVPVFQGEAVSSPASASDLVGDLSFDRHRLESSPNLAGEPQTSSLRGIRPCVKTLYWGCRVRPRVLVVGARASITSLKWQHWGFDSATGIGMITNGASTGQPESGFGPLPARVRYWGRVRCRWGSVFRVQRFSYDLKGATKVHEYRDRRPCSR